jgi:hypothetical protein
MFVDLQTWQWIVAAIVAALSIGWMSAAILRLFTRRASGRASVRKATDLESGLLGGTLPDGARAFDAWAYRVAARFAGRIRIVVYPDRVAVAGPRVPRVLYQAWVWVQGLLLALALPALAAAVVALDWRWLVAAFLLWLVSFGISFGGAGLWPGLGEVLQVEDHFRALEFPRADVHEVDIGKGWAKGGFEVVLFPYKAGIDQMARGRAVSFFAPDERGREVRFAVDMSPEHASELAALLGRPPAGQARASVPQ